MNASLFTLRNMVYGMIRFSHFELMTGQTPKGLLDVLKGDWKNLHPDRPTSHLAYL